MSEQTTGGTAAEPSGEDVRRQLEAIAARTRTEAGQRETSPATEPLSLRRRSQIEADRRAELAEADRRAEDETTETERLARGEWPRRMEHETEREWSARGTSWKDSPLGVAAFAEKARVDRARQDAGNREVWPEVVKQSGVPAQFASLVASGSLIGSDALVEIKRKPSAMTVLAGKVGVGKSVAAAWWLLQDYLPGGSGDLLGGSRGKKLARPLWVSAARLARWARYDDEEMARLLQASRLVIDDLYMEFADAKGNFQVTLDEVVNDRLSNDRPLVITSNLDVDGFRERYGERIADRIREHGRFAWFVGDSMRRRLV